MVVYATPLRSGRYNIKFLAGIPKEQEQPKFQPRHGLGFGHGL